MTKTKIDHTISIENALGVDTLVDTVGERYAQLRRASSENTLAMLAAQDQEYARRQGLRNMHFITGSVSHLPNLAKPDYDVDQSSYFAALSTTRIHTNRISEVKIPFVVSEAEVEAIDGETLASLSSLRATTIWIPRDVEDVSDLESERYDYGYRDRVKNKLEENHVEIPYVIMGHRLLQNGGYTEVILMPLVSPSQRGYDGRKLVTKLAPITVRMTTEAYTRLISVQDTLLGEGLTPAEIKRAHDTKKGTFTIEPSVLPCVRATMRRSAMGMAMSRMPSDHRDLGEDFDLQQTDTVLEQIHPSEFTNYNVLSDVQRLFAMFGVLDEFEKIKDDLLKTSLSDPALKLLEE